MEPVKGVRINKYLADQGTATRVAADALVSAGAVRINGRIAVLGDKVLPTDTVVVHSKKNSQKKELYMVCNKPRSVMSHSAGDGEEDIQDILPEELKSSGLFPLGRLDKDSHGLLLLTTDGRVTNRLLNPDAGHEKEYVVKVQKELPRDFAKRMSSGVYIEGYVTKPAVVEVRGAKTFSITLTEGKKHQIRRMVAALGNVVTDLQRVRVMHIRLGKLPSGSIRDLTPEERSRLLSALSLPDSN